MRQMEKEWQNQQKKIAIKKSPLTDGVCKDSGSFVVLEFADDDRHVTIRDGIEGLYVGSRKSSSQV
jgi:hypothetical protein